MHEKKFSEKFSTNEAYFLRKSIIVLSKSIHNAAISIIISSNNDWSYFLYQFAENNL